MKLIYIQFDDFFCTILHFLKISYYMSIFIYFFILLFIANSLREFGRLIAAIEDEKDRLLDRAYEQFIVPLENFRKEQIGAVKERKKKFEKQTAKFCASQERYLGLSTKNKDTVLQEVRVVKTNLHYIDDSISNFIYYKQYNRKTSYER